MKNQIVIDASGGILGRVAGFAAKQALLGREVSIVNCDDILISGNKSSVIKKYTVLRQKGGSSLKGPKISRSPEKIVKRTARGMLPHKQERGSEALKRIKCYNKTPAELESKEKTSLKREIKIKAIKLSRVSELI
jgi:large subunit ribosomal protein L13